MITVTRAIWISLSLKLSVSLFNQEVVNQFAHLHYVTAESEEVKEDAVYRPTISLQ